MNQFSTLFRICSCPKRRLTIGLLVVLPFSVGFGSCEFSSTSADRVAAAVDRASQQIEQAPAKIDVVLENVLKEVRALEGQAARDLEGVLVKSIALTGAEARCSTAFAAEQIAALARRGAAAVRLNKPDPSLKDVAVVCYVNPTTLDIRDPQAVVEVVGFGLGSSTVEARTVGGSTRAVSKLNIGTRPNGVTISLPDPPTPHGPLYPDSTKLQVIVAGRVVEVMLKGVRSLCSLQGVASIATGKACWETDCTGWFRSGEILALEVDGQLGPENREPTSNAAWSAQIQLIVNDQVLETINPKDHAMHLFRLPSSRATFTVGSDGRVKLAACVPRVDVWAGRDGNLVTEPNFRVSLNRMDM